MWPAIRPALGGGELLPVEAVTTEQMRTDLDILAGIDAWHIVRREGGIRGIASRVQADGNRWDTFTIRYKRATGSETEFDKRMRAIRQSHRGWMYPHLTVQAYLSADRETLLSWGVVNTRELYLYVDRELLNDRNPGIQIRSNGQDGNQFIAVLWSRLRNAGIEVKHA